MIALEFSSRQAQALADACRNIELVGRVSYVRPKAIDEIIDLRKQIEEALRNVG